MYEQTDYWTPIQQKNFKEVTMFNLLKSIFNGSAEKKEDNNLPENSTETKKCLNCLRRVNINVSKCPHCRSDNFQY